jgi:hypothetical protein
MRLRRLIAGAVVALGSSVVAVAQHGGGGHGGGGGGFHGGGGGFASHAGGGVSMGAPGGGFARPVSRGGGGVYARYGQPGRGFGGESVVPNGRPGFYHRQGDRRRGYGVGYGAGLEVGYGDYGWLDADGLDYDSGYQPGYDPGYGAGYDSGENGAYAGIAQDGAGDGGYGAQGFGGKAAVDGEPPVPYVAQAVARRSSAVQPRLYNSDAVTLVFKDGRAPEKIHNYALTRTTLYVTDGRREEIPVASLDLAATEKVNRAAGVRFDLPVLR